MMKQSIILFFLTALVCVSPGCKKVSEGDSLIGAWELRQSTGGMTPAVSYSPGNGNILKFTDNSYELYTNSQFTRSGSYTLQFDNTAQTNVCLVIQPGEYTNRIIYDSDSSGYKEFLQVSGNTLTFVKGCFALDAGQKLVYERQ